MRHPNRLVVDFETVPASESPEILAAALEARTEVDLPEPVVPLDESPRALHSQLEALLFVASEALSLEKLIRLTGADAETVTTTLAELEAEYAERGITVRAVAGGYRFATAPKTRDVVEAYLLPPKTSLSPAALETLAIIAYSQPITKAEIEAVRGVSVDGVVSMLNERGFVAEMGRKETVGKPMLFGTTSQFLEAFGLASLADLPPLPDEQAERLGAELASPAILEGTIDEDALVVGEAAQAVELIAETEAEIMTATLIENVMDPIDPRPIEPNDPEGPIDPIEPTEPIEPIGSPLQDAGNVKPDAYSEAVEYANQAAMNDVSEIPVEFVDNLQTHAGEEHATEEARGDGDVLVLATS